VTAHTGLPLAEGLVAGPQERRDHRQAGLRQLAWAPTLLVG